MRRKLIVQIAASNSGLPKDFDVSQRNTKLRLPEMNSLKLFSYFILFRARSLPEIVQRDEVFVIWQLTFAFGPIILVSGDR